MWPLHGVSTIIAFDAAVEKKNMCVSDEMEHIVCCSSFPLGGDKGNWSIIIIACAVAANNRCISFPHLSSSSFVCSDMAAFLTLMKMNAPTCVRLPTIRDIMQEMALVQSIGGAGYHQ